MTSKNSSKRSLLTKAKAYFALTKPRVIELLLIATVPAMILAERGMPSIWLRMAVAGVPMWSIWKNER